MKIGELIAIVKADTVHFERGMKRVEKQVEAVTANLEKMGRSLTVTVTAPLVALGTQAIKAATSMDSLKRGLTAVTGSSKEAERQLARLKEVAKLPGLGFEEAVRGAINLQAAGLKAELAERSLKAFGNALATVGKGKAELDGVILALGQIQSKGKVSAEEINQLAERVPQIRKAMEAAFGTANTELLQKAKIGSEEFTNAIVRHLERLPQATGGAQNAFENFSDKVQEGLREIGDAVLPDVLRAMDRLQEKLDQGVRWWRGLSQAQRDGFIKAAEVALVTGPTILALSTIGKAVTGLTGLFGGLKAATLFLRTPGGLIGAGVLGAAGLAIKAVSDLDAEVREADRKRWEAALPQLKQERLARDRNPAERTRIIQQLQRSIAANEAFFREGNTMGPTRDKEVRANIAMWRTEIERLQALGKPSAGLGVAGVNLNAIQRAALEEQRKAQEQLAKERQKQEEAEAKRRVELAVETTQRMNEELARLQLDSFDFRRRQAQEEYRDNLKNGADRLLARRLLQEQIQQVDIEETRFFAEQEDRRLELVKAANKEWLKTVTEGWDKSAQAQANSIAGTVKATIAQAQGIQKGHEALAGLSQALATGMQKFGQSVGFAVITDQWEQEAQEAERIAAWINEAIARQQEAELAAMRARTEEAKTLMQSVANSAQDMFARTFDDLFENGFNRFFENVLSGFRRLLQNMAAQYLSSQLTRLFMGLVGNFVPGVAGPTTVKNPTLQQLGGALGGLGGLLPGRATGGPVMGGRAYLVGEQGPEVFLPGRSGYVAAGGGNITINMTVMAQDAASFRRTETQVGAEIARQLDIHRRRNG